MDLATAMATLEAAGTEQNRKTYRRHGARDPMFGVSFAVMRPLAKRAKRDQALARELWGTGNYDARILACMVADPAIARPSATSTPGWPRSTSTPWSTSSSSRWPSQVPGVRARADRWTASDRDWTSQAGWDLYAQLALNDPSADDAFFSGLLERIEARHPRRRQPHPAQHERRPDRDRRPERAAARRGGGGQRADRHRRRRPRRDRLRDPGRGAVHREDLGPQGGARAGGPTRGAKEPVGAAV